eukprot:g7498.t1
MLAIQFYVLDGEQISPRSVSQTREDGPQVLLRFLRLLRSGVIDWSEFLTFVARGPKRPEDEAKLFALRTKRVHRNLRMAFNKFQTDQAAVQKLFEKIDRGSDGKISIHELLSFVRSDLKLSKWDVFESEMKSFYRTMDTDGDGVVVEELLQFIHKTRSTDSGRHERWPERTALRRTAAEERRWSESKQLSLPKPAPDSEGCAALAMKALEEGKPFDALISCERALRTCATSESLRCGMLSALALESLGLLNLAQERLGQAARMAKDVDLSTLQMALEAMKRVRGRERQIEEGDAQVLMEEIQRMGALLGDQEAGYWISCVGECSRSKEGQAELVQKGFLLEAHRNLQQPAQVARHASLVALRYRINKKLQRHLSAAGLLMGVADQCLLPKALHSPLSVDPLEEQLRQSLDELRAKRLVVLDEVLPPEALCKVKLELQRMRQEQVLQNDTNDAKYLPFADDATQFRESCPVTMQVMQRLAALASILEEELGLQLAVPKSAMAACYPPKASYKMHLDSYFLHGWGLRSIFAEEKDYLDPRSKC